MAKNQRFEFVFLSKIRNKREQIRLKRVHYLKLGGLDKILIGPHLITIAAPTLEIFKRLATFFTFFFSWLESTIKFYLIPVVSSTNLCDQSIEFHDRKSFVLFFSGLIPPR